MLKAAYYALQVALGCVLLLAGLGVGRFEVWVCCFVWFCGFFLAYSATGHLKPDLQVACHARRRDFVYNIAF